MSNFVISTMTSAVNYCIYIPLPGNAVKVKHMIRVNGGANMTHPKSLAVPGGSATAVSDEELAELEKHPLFKFHREQGYLKVIKDSSKYAAAEKAENPSGLEKKDKSAQKKPCDYKKEGGKAPKTKKD